MYTQYSVEEKSKEKITSSSSPEEIADFLSKRFKLSEEIIQNLKSQSISGDILPSLNDEEFKLLGFKLGPMKKVKKYLSENKNDFPEKEFEKKININSTKEEAKDILNKYIGIEEDIDLDGKSLLNLSKDDIEKIGLNIGNKIKLKKYLEYLNSIKKENLEKEKELNEKIDKIKENEMNKDKNEEKKQDKKEEQEESKAGQNTEKEKKEIQEKEWTAKLEEIDAKKLRKKKIKNLNLESKYNIFFILSLTNNYNDNDYKLDIYNGEVGEKYMNYPFNILSDEETKALDEEKRRTVLIQVPSEEPIKNLFVKIIKTEKEEIKEEILSEDYKDKKEENKNEIIIEHKEKEVENISEEKKEELEDKKEKDVEMENKDKIKEDKKENEDKEDKKEKEEDKKEKELIKENKEENENDKIKEKIEVNDKEQKNKEIKEQIKEKIKSIEFICKININNEISNYFHFSNLSFTNLSDYIIFEEKINFLFDTYISFFLKESIISKRNFKKDIIQSLLYSISLIKNENHISFTLNNLFYIFKLCLEFNLQINNISSVDFIQDSNNIKEENLLTSEELDSLFTLIKEKDEKDINSDIKLFASFIIKFYASNSQYKDLIKDFLDSKNRKYYIRDIFTLLIQDELKIDNLDIMKNEEKLNLIKKEFLEVANTKEEINFILYNFFKKLIDTLQFINKNISLICEILEKRGEKKKNKKNKNKEEINYI